jgi:hydroxymethylpyrimidine pyrophosphatase-like HAD family hydrolase
MGPQAEMAALEAGLDAALPGRLSLHTIKSPRYRDWMCEIAPAGVTKWSGVMSVATSWGITADEICAVGDDVNDIPMIRAAGIGVAMGNARPEVMAVADLVVGSSDGRGITDVADMVLAGLA